MLRNRNENNQPRYIPGLNSKRSVFYPDVWKSQFKISQLKTYLSVMLDIKGCLEELLHSTFLALEGLHRI